jgi:hypothetical protein
MKKNKGKIKNAVSLVANGLTFKSKLELFTYNKLIEAGIIDFKYEEKKFVLLEAFEFTNESYELKKDKSLVNASKNIRSITYLPDFTNIDDFNNGWVLECKGYPNDAFPLKWKWFKDHLVKNNYNVTLYKPNNQANVLKTIELIKNKYYV